MSASEIVTQIIDASLDQFKQGDACFSPPSTPRDQTYHSLDFSTHKIHKNPDEKKEQDSIAFGREPVMKIE